jgi:hypothetical protein
MPEVSKIVAESQQAMSIKFNAMLHEPQQRGK